MWGLSPLHLVIILIIVLIVVGPGKLPETGVAIGKALRGFKDALEGVDQPPQPPSQQVQTPYMPPASSPGQSAGQGQETPRQ